MWLEQHEIDHHIDCVFVCYVLSVYVGMNGYSFTHTHSYIHRWYPTWASIEWFHIRIQMLFESACDRMYSEVPSIDSVVYHACSGHHAVADKHRTNQLLQSTDFYRRNQRFVFWDEVERNGEIQRKKLNITDGVISEWSTMLLIEFSAVGRCSCPSDSHNQMSRSFFRLNDSSRYRKAHFDRQLIKHTITIKRVRMGRLF